MTQHVADYAAPAIGGSVWHFIAHTPHHGQIQGCRPPDNLFRLDQSRALRLQHVERGKRCRQTGCATAWQSFDQENSYPA